MKNIFSINPVALRELRQLVRSKIITVSLAIFPAIEAYFKNRSNHFEIHLELKNSAFLQNFVATIRKLGLVIDDIELNPAYAGSGLSVYTIAITVSSAERISSASG